MASAIQVGDKWRARVRRKGHPTQTRKFKTKVLADRWARQIETDIGKGEFKYARDLTKITVSDLIARYRSETTNVIRRSKDDCLKQIDRRIGQRELAGVNADLMMEYARNRGTGRVTWGI